MLRINKVGNEQKREILTNLYYQENSFEYFQQFNFQVLMCKRSEATLISLSKRTVRELKDFMKREAFNSLSALTNAEAAICILNYKLKQSCELGNVCIDQTMLILVNSASAHGNFVSFWLLMFILSSFV